MNDLLTTPTPAADARADRRERLTGPGSASYQPSMHLAASFVLTCGACGLATFRLDRPTGAQWLALPLTVLLANLFEWASHRYILHRPHWPPTGANRRHALHHAAFPMHDLSLRSTKEMRFILIDMPDLVGLAIVSAVFGCIAWLLFGANCGWLVFMGCMLSMLAYEWSHLLYHLPASSALGGGRIVQKLRRHHAVHHDPKLMTRYNFNVTLPICDVLFGTMAPRSATARKSIRKS